MDAKLLDFAYQPQVAETPFPTFKSPVLQKIDDDIISVASEDLKAEKPSLSSHPIKPESLITSRQSSGT